MADDEVKKSAKVDLLAGNVPLHSVYFVGDTRAFESNMIMGWATIDAGSTPGQNCDSITLVGGHTVVIKKKGQVMLVPWLRCKDGRALG